MFGFWRSAAAPRALGAYREQRALAGRRGAGRPELDLLGYAPRSQRLAQLLRSRNGRSRSHCVCLDCTALGMPSVLHAASFPEGRITSKRLYARAVAGSRRESQKFVAECRRASSLAALRSIVSATRGSRASLGVQCRGGMWIYGDIQHAIQWTTSGRPCIRGGDVVCRNLAPYASESRYKWRGSLHKSATPERTT